MSEEYDPLAKSADKPNMTEILSEFRQSGSTGDFWNRLQLDEETRLAIWDGQSDDGKKHSDNLPEGEPAFPWEGANDARVFLSDSIINHLVSASVAAFWRGEIKVAPVDPQDIDKANRRTTFLNWMVRQKMREQLDVDVELSAQYSNWYGWCGLHPTWQREIGYCMRYITPEEVFANAQAIMQATDLSSVDETSEEGRLLMAIGMFPELIADENREDEAIAAARVIVDYYAEQHAPPEIDKDEIRPFGKKRAKKLVRDLRSGKGGTVPVPHLIRNGPCIEALKPWYQLIVPTSSVSVQDARILFVRRYYTEAQVRSMGIADGWDKKWMEDVVKTHGRVSVWTDQSIATRKIWEWKWDDNQSNMVEIVWAFTRSIDEDGITGIWCTVFSPHLEGDEAEMAYGKHEQLNYAPGMYPITGVARERIDRSILYSRGVPEIAITDQREQKVCHDGIIDLLNISVIPPLLVPKSSMGQKYAIGPATNIDVTAGREPKFMEIPTKGAPLSMEFVDHIEMKNARYFGVFHPEIPVADTQLKLEGQVRRFLQSWACALKQAYSLCVKYAPDMIERVTGKKPDISEQYDLGDFDLMFHFDTIQLDPDLLERKLEAFSKLLPEDSTGTINRSTLTALKAKMIDPELSRAVVTDQSQANERLVREVQQDLIAMFLGNQVPMRDASDDPTAQGRFNVLAQSIQGNPRYLSALDPKIVAEIYGPEAAAQVPEGGQVDPVFSKRVEQYVKNLKMGVMQQQNKMVGRTGVTQ